MTPALLSQPGAMPNDLVRGVEMAERICSVNDCRKSAKKRGFCTAHYHRWRRHGDPLKGARLRPKDPVERLMLRVAVTEGGCWEWAAARNNFGYGSLWLVDRKIPAHRAAYILLVGPIPEGYELDHLCRNPPCCNPAHLEPVTHRENVMRGLSPTAANAAKTRCPQGHPYDDENTYITPSGRRECRTCTKTRLSDRKSRRGRDADVYCLAVKPQGVQG